MNSSMQVWHCHCFHLKLLCMDQVLLRLFDADVDHSGPDRDSGSTSTPVVQKVTPGHFVDSLAEYTVEALYLIMHLNDRLFQLNSSLQ